MNLRDGSHIPRRIPSVTYARVFTKSGVLFQLSFCADITRELHSKRDQLFVLPVSTLIGYFDILYLSKFDIIFTDPIYFTYDTIFSV